jgi:hypothetical protein
MWISKSASKKRLCAISKAFGKTSQQIIEEYVLSGKINGL